MIIKRITRIVFFTFLFLVSANTTFAQANNEDIELKDSLYKKHKKEVLAYDKRDFDNLFLEYFKKERDKSGTLTKDEFYTYTVKIAIYSEKLGLLYKDKKDVAQKTKQEWFDKSYSDYLNSKK